MANVGSISLDRRLLDWEWHDEPLIGWLWVNLLLMANYKDKKWHNMVVKRGQIVTSVEKLSIQTGLSEWQVRTRLDKLEKTGCITKKTTNKNTIINVCKYDSYQIQSADNHEQTTNNPLTNHEQTTTNNKENNDNNINNIKENTLTSVKENAAAAAARAKENLLKRKKVFYDELIPYVDTYGKNMLREFYEYWTEENKSGTKFRKELEKTWSTPRRLQTWASRERVNPATQVVNQMNEAEAKHNNQLTDSDYKRAEAIRAQRERMIREREQKQQKL